jgi:hypothetical protein
MFRNSELHEIIFLESRFRKTERKEKISADQLRKASRQNEGIWSYSRASCSEDRSQLGNFERKVEQQDRFHHKRNC